MRVSEKRASALYAAVRDPIVDLRVWVQSRGPLSAAETDRALYDLEAQIWQRLNAALNLEHK
jgi:hypothetical protein